MHCIVHSKTTKSVKIIPFCVFSIQTICLFIYCFGYWFVTDDNQTELRTIICSTYWILGFITFVVAMVTFFYLEQIGGYKSGLKNHMSIHKEESDTR